MSRSSSAKTKSENRMVRYLRDTRAEVAKVTWPTRQEGIRLTIIVAIVTLISAIVLFGIDYLFGTLIGLLITSV